MITDEELLAFLQWIDTHPNGAPLQTMAKDLDWSLEQIGDTFKYAADQGFIARAPDKPN